MAIVSLVNIYVSSGKTMYLHVHINVARVGVRVRVMWDSVFSLHMHIGLC